MVEVLTPTCDGFRVCFDGRVPASCDEMFLSSSHLRVWWTTFKNCGNSIGFKIIFHL